MAIDVTLVDELLRPLDRAAQQPARNAAANVPSSHHCAADR